MFAIGWCVDSKSCREPPSTPRVRADCYVIESTPTLGTAYILLRSPPAKLRFDDEMLFLGD